jgi:methylmalonyl-CoA carboxyltransferase 12S subunit
MPTTERKIDAAQFGGADNAPTGTLESLRLEIARLSERIVLLEKSLATKPAATTTAQPKPAEEAIAPEIVLAISAAVAAYLGLEPHIRQIRLVHNHPWGQQGRVTIQASHRIGASHG